MTRQAIRHAGSPIELVCMIHLACVPNKPVCISLHAWTVLQGYLISLLYDTVTDMY